MKDTIPEDSPWIVSAKELRYRREAQMMQRVDVAPGQSGEMPTLFGRPFDEALRLGLEDGTVGITGVQMAQDVDSAMRIEVGFIIAGAPKPRPLTPPNPWEVQWENEQAAARQQAKATKPKPGDICPICAGLGVDCRPCDGEGVVQPDKFDEFGNPVALEDLEDDEVSGSSYAKVPNTQTIPPNPGPSRATSRGSLSSTPAPTTIVTKGGSRKTFIYSDPIPTEEEIEGEMSLYSHDDPQTMRRIFQAEYAWKGRIIRCNYEIDEMMLDSGGVALEGEVKRLMAREIAKKVVSEKQKESSAYARGTV